MPVPSFESLLKNPTEAERLSPDQAAQVLAEAGALQARLSGLGMAIAARLIDHGAATVTASRLLTLREAAERLGFTVPFVRRLVQRHELPAVRAGKYVRILDSALAQWQCDKQDDGAIHGPPPAVPRHASAAPMRHRSRAHRV